MAKTNKEHLDYAELLIDGLESFADSLEAGEDVTAKFNCHKVVLDLQPTPYSKELVKKTRNLLKTSQSIFAQFLGVSVRTVQAWERGEKTPSDMACRFMDEIRTKPEYWQKRFLELAKPRVVEA